MSSIGTGVAASVAQVAQNAQQSARAKDKARAGQDRVARDGADHFDQQLQSTTQADDPDAQLPDHQAPGYEQLYLHDRDGQPLAPPRPLPGDTPPSAGLSEPNLTGFVTYGPSAAPAHPLYQHLDIKA
ncbi:MAG: hypothetical protein AAGG38_11045 [Planctomycetota bacterium]